MCVETHKGTHKSEIVLKHHAKREHIVVNKPLLEMEKKLPENILPKFSSEGSRGLRGNGVVNTLLHVDQIFEKEVDILDAEAGKA